jgi:glycosyltransferase involved in cell wall biosynthesis
MPRMDIASLEQLAKRCAATVRFVPRFITDPEIPAYFRRADIVVLPYRAIEQSGVLYTALAFGNAIVASSVGGFTEIAERDSALRLVGPGDPDALRAALAELLGDDQARTSLAGRAAEAAATTYSWSRIAARTLDVYRGLPPR